MTTYSAIAVVEDETRAAALGDALDALGPSGVGVFEIEDGSGRWEVGAYFQERPDAPSLALLSAAYAAGDFVVSAIEDRDWVAQVRRELTPVRAGRFVVHGGHDRDAVPPNALSLEIEAAMAFGTGHHGTTEGCLLALDRLHRRGLRAHKIADIGCGTGVLAMAAARLGKPGGGPVRITATDIDPVAGATVCANIAANGLRGRIQSGLANGFRGAIPQSAAPFDLIFANILAKPLKTLAPSMAARCAPGGVVILSGMLSRQAPGVVSVYRGWSFAPLLSVERRGWATVALRRHPRRQHL